MYIKELNLSSDLLFETRAEHMGIATESQLKMNTNYKLLPMICEYSLKKVQIKSNDLMKFVQFNIERFHTKMSI